MMMMTTIMAIVNDDCDGDCDVLLLVQGPSTSSRVLFDRRIVPELPPLPIFPWGSV